MKNMIGIGKTTLALHAIANAQKAGGIAVLVDAELQKFPPLLQINHLHTPTKLLGNPFTHSRHILTQGKKMNIYLHKRIEQTSHNQVRGHIIVAKTWLPLTETLSSCSSFFSVLLSH